MYFRTRAETPPLLLLPHCSPTELPRDKGSGTSVLGPCPFPSYTLTRHIRRCTNFVPLWSGRASFEPPRPGALVPPVTPSLSRPCTSLPKSSDALSHVFTVVSLSFPTLPLQGLRVDPGCLRPIPKRVCLIRSDPPVLRTRGGLECTAGFEKNSLILPAFPPHHRLLLVRPEDPPGWWRG